jgi:peptide/nickel transport system substrate-binding protein
LYPQVPAREFARLQRSETSQKKLSFHTAPSYDVVTAGFNTRRPALADAGTRHALSRLFDVPGLLRATQMGEGRRTVGLISPADPANYNDSLDLPPFSPAATAVLLRQAGWQQNGGWQRPGPAGTTQRLELEVRYRADEALFETVALQFRAAAGQLGIPVRLRPTESSALTPSLQAGDFDLYVRTLKGNPFIFNFAPILHSSAVGEGNLTGYGTPASDQLIEAVAVAASPARKARLLRRLQARLQADLPVVPLFFLPMRIAAARHLTDLHVTGLKPGFAAAALGRRTQPPRR